MSESSEIMSLMAKEYLPGQTRGSMMAPGSRTRCMAKALFFGQINGGMKETIIRVKSMALENSTGLTGAPSVDNGPTARKMARGPT